MKPISYFADGKTWTRYKKILFSWIGTPYRHLTMVKGRGADCTLFIAAVLIEAKVMSRIEYDYYPKDWHIHTTEEKVLDGFFRHMTTGCFPGFTFARLDTGHPKHRGDILTFSTTSTGVSNHAGVYLGDDKMIHSIEQRGVSVIPCGNFFTNKMTGIFRLIREGS